MANVSSSNGLEKRPKLRFPGFDEPWKAEKLSDFADRVTRKNSKNETNLPLTISSKDGLVDQVSYFNKTVASKDMSGYYLLKNGEFAYNKSYSVGYDFGSIKRLDRYPMGALSTLYICFTLKKHDSDFIKAYFDSLKWYREIYMISAEGARNHGLLNVPTDEFFETKHYLPENTDEQRKIADFIIALERRIEAQQSLVDNLKKYKRGAVDGLLSRKIKFRASDNWEEIRIADLFSPISDKGHGDLTVLTIVQGTGTLPRDSVDRRISYDKTNTNTYKRVIENDFILHLRSFEGGLEIANSEGIVSPAYTILRASKEISPMFYYAYFRSYWFISNKLRMAVEGIRDGKSINMDTFWNIRIPYPTLVEQTQIAEYLQAIDLKLANAEKTLDNLMSARRGLMQQLFI
ncbi:type I restriction enzyme, S subunit [Oscillibacter sp. PC13]|uniref:restriction endonuclease subunit S n=1 Tax=Oscillibacter sp. PC13 TaxID=1855299 RepID=UPI0008F425C4|nr:restriction endonuclease subunit S [Oscillibacter sp. PC13]SFP41704.1 type I restriction enzyme, S subunit [Oscillibacter sp. PC13]